MVQRRFSALGGGGAGGWAAAVRWSDVETAAAEARCPLCGAKDVSEPRGEEKYCRDCWDKKIAVEEIVAREFALKRYIRAHSAEKYLVYHSTLKRPCGQLVVVDDGFDLFLTLVLYPNFQWDEPAYHLENDPEGRSFAELLVDVARHRSDRAVGRRQVAPGSVPLGCRRAGRMERRDVTEVARRSRARAPTARPAPRLAAARGSTWLPRAALRARPEQPVIEPWGGGKWHLEVFRSGAAEPEEWNGEL